MSVRSPGFDYPVTLYWRNTTWWNDALADVMEVFGLPGDRFVTQASLETITIYFKSAKDQALCKILLSERLGSQSVALSQWG